MFSAFYELVCGIIAVPVPDSGLILFQIHDLDQAVPGPHIIHYMVVHPHHLEILPHLFEGFLSLIRRDIDEPDLAFVSGHCLQLLCCLFTALHDVLLAEVLQPVLYLFFILLRIQHFPGAVSHIDIRHQAVGQMHVFKIRFHFIQQLHILCGDRCDPRLCLTAGKSRQSLLLFKIPFFQALRTIILEPRRDHFLIFSRVYDLHHPITGVQIRKDMIGDFHLLEVFFYLAYIPRILCRDVQIIDIPLALLDEPLQVPVFPRFQVPGFYPFRHPLH